MQLRLWILLALLTLLLTASFRSPAGAADLTSSLQRVLRQPSLRGATTGVLVLRLADGHVLFESGADKALTPASNMKVLTAIAALAEFGPAYRFKTYVSAERGPDGSGSVPRLAVRGTGDPSLTSEEWWRLAANLHREGLRRVTGGVLLDDSSFDQQRWHPAWGDVGSRAYHSPVAALNANYGSFTLEVRSGTKLGAPVYVSIDPPLPYFQLANRVRTGPSSERSSLWIDRQASGDGDAVNLGGAVPAGMAPAIYHRSVTDPSLYAGAVLRMQLEANGIRVEGPMRRGIAPSGWNELAAFPGKSVAETVRLMMKYSNNSIAESLVKAMGVRKHGMPGTWEKGVAAVAARLRDLGLDLSACRLVDGSGLARENAITPRLLVQALVVAHESFQFGPEFVGSLPVAATDGTLEKRATNAIGVVRAKTGLLEGVTGLSGYVRMADGTRAVFSILVNGYRGGGTEAMAALDAFVSALASHNGTTSRTP